MKIRQTDFNYEVRKLEVIDSTNNYLRPISLPDDTDFLYVTSEYQTAGKGQGGNHWESERGENLLFSVKCKPWRVKASEQFILLQTVSVAVCKALSRILNKQCMIKWPNDIYFGDKKLSGTLSECTLHNIWINEFIAGVGINVNQLAFHSDAPNPVSMANISGHTFDRNALLDDIAKEISNWFEYITNEDMDTVRTEYESLLYRRTGIHKYRDKDGAFDASYEDILPNGHLILRRTDGILSEYEFKEVKFLIPISLRQSQRILPHHRQ